MLARIVLGAMLVGSAMANPVPAAVAPIMATTPKLVQQAIVQPQPILQQQQPIQLPIKQQLTGHATAAPKWHSKPKPVVKEVVPTAKVQEFTGFYDLPVLLPITMPIMSSQQRLETARLVAAKTPAHPQTVYVKGEEPIVAPVLSEGTKWSKVEEMARAKPRMLSTINLKPIVQKFEVHSNQYSQEHVKKPITEPIVQPYLQEYIQQAQPVVHPIVQRITQPIIHRELHPLLSATTIKAGDLPLKLAKKEFTTFTNKPIVGQNLPSLKIQKKHSEQAKHTKKHSEGAKVMSKLPGAKFHGTGASA